MRGRSVERHEGVRPSMRPSNSTSQGPLPATRLRQTGLAPDDTRHAVRTYTAGRPAGQRDAGPSHGLSGVARLALFATILLVSIATYLVLVMSPTYVDGRFSGAEWVKFVRASPRAGDSETQSSRQDSRLPIAIAQGVSASDTRVQLPEAKHQGQTASEVDDQRTSRTYQHMRECVMWSELPVCAASAKSIPEQPPPYAELEQHYHDLLNVTAPWRGNAIGYHRYSNYSGPWLENYWIDTFVSKPFSYWYPFVPLFIRWTDLCVGNDSDTRSWRRSMQTCEQLGYLLGRQPLPVRIVASRARRRPSAEGAAVPELAASPTSTPSAKPKPGKTILRRDVIYITVLQDSQGLRAAPDCWWIRNVLILGAGGFGNVPLPLIKGNLPAHAAGSPKRRKSVFSFAGKVHYNRTAAFDALRLAGYPATDPRLLRVYQGASWQWIMASSMLTLAPRAIGSTSFRLYEALQLGTVPVYVWWGKSLWLPYHNTRDTSKSLWWIVSLPRGAAQAGNAANALDALWGGRSVSALQTAPPIGIVVSLADLQIWAQNVVCSLLSPDDWKERGKVWSGLDVGDGTAPVDVPPANMEGGPMDTGDKGGTPENDIVDVPSALDADGVDPAVGAARRLADIDRPSAAQAAQPQAVLIHTLCGTDGIVHMQSGSARRVTEYHADSAATPMDERGASASAPGIAPLSPLERVQLGILHDTSCGACNATAANNLEVLAEIDAWSHEVDADVPTRSNHGRALPLLDWLHSVIQAGIASSAELFVAAVQCARSAAGAAVYDRGAHPMRHEMSPTTAASRDLLATDPAEPGMPPPRHRADGGDPRAPRVVKVPRKTPSPSPSPSPDPRDWFSVHDDSLLARMERRISQLRDSHFTYEGLMRQIDAFITDPTTSDLACVQRPAWRPPGTGWFAVRPQER